MDGSGGGGIHLIINILIAAIGVCLYLGNRKTKKKIMQNIPHEHIELLVKLKYILDCSEYDIFQIAAKEKGCAPYIAEQDFSKYLKSGAEYLPVYLKDFLDEGREYIIKTKVNRGLFGLFRF